MEKAFQINLFIEVSIVFSYASVILSISNTSFYLSRYPLEQNLKVDGIMTILICSLIY